MGPEVPGRKTQLEIDLVQNSWHRDDKKKFGLKKTYRRPPDIGIHFDQNADKDEKRYADGRQDNVSQPGHKRPNKLGQFDTQSNVFFDMLKQ